MKEKESVVFADYESESYISFDELCAACRINEEFIHQLIAFDIISKRFVQVHKTAFDLNTVKKIKTAQRLQKDLEINLPGIALVLDLLEEIAELRKQKEIHEKHFNQHKVL